MVRYPDSPDEILDEFVADYRDLLQDELISIILYGSAAAGRYVAKKSDINFLIVLTQPAIQSISRVFPLVKKWQNRAVSIPMFITEAYLDSSLDSFPLEFSNLRHAHRTVFGKDVLAPLQIAPELLRLQCEAQIKGKLLHLRGDFLATLGESGKMKALISASVPVFANVFKGLLTLKGVEPSLRYEDLFLAVAEQYALDRTVMERVLAAGQSNSKLDDRGWIELTESYIAEIRKLALKIDQFN